MKAASAMLQQPTYLRIPDAIWASFNKKNLVSLVVVDRDAI